MKQVKEQPLEPQPGQWWVEQSKDEPIKHPRSRRRRPLLNNNSSRKPKQMPHTNRVPTHLSEHSLPVWTLAVTPLSESWSNAFWLTRQPLTYVGVPASN